MAADGVNAHRAGEIYAVEVYTNPFHIPPEFSTASMQCGAIILWTEHGLGRRRRR